MQTEKKYFNSTDARTLITRYNFALIPIHGVVDNLCTCGVFNCSNIGKHPATKNGLTDATKDIEQLIKLWDKRKGLNVGIATGAVSGIFVIDIDGAIGEADIAKLGILPATLTATTGRGRHLFFKHPGKDIKTRRGVIGNKVDVRGDGGYVVGAGSNHATGAVYEWYNPLEDIVDAPQWLLDIVMKEKVTEISAPPQINAPRLFVSNSWQESDVIEMLRYISPDIGYDEWIKVGMAIQSEGFGFQIWDNWSSVSSKYQQGGMASHWRSFKPGHGVSFGTLVKMAQDGGWGRKQDHFVAPTKMVPNTPLASNVPIAETVIPATEQNQPLTKAPNKKEHAPIGYVMAKDITMNTESNDFVQGLLADNQLSVIYGESNCGKTFFMTDLCFHIATGRRWRDRRVDKGGIIYAALEGSYGLRNRVAAYRLTHGLDNALFAMVASQVDFLSPEGNIDQFIDCIKRATDDMGSCKMVVVDTLSRALSGGDENSGQDMGMLVHHADRIRYETGAHVCFIHHAGKNKALGARGHSSLRAAVDTEIEISREDGADYSTIKVAKQREMEAGEDMYFGLEKVVLAVNGLSEEITSCVVRVIDPDDVEAPKHDKVLTAMQQFVYDAIVNAIAIVGKRRVPRQGVGNVVCISYEQLGEELEQRGFKKLTDAESRNAKTVTNNTRLALKRCDKIDFNDGWIWLTQEK